MPEASVDEYDSMILRKHNIRLSWKTRIVLPVAKTVCEQVFTPDRINDQQQKKKVKDMLKRLRKYVKDNILSLRASNGSEAINLSIGEYLSADVPDKNKNRAKQEDLSDDVSAVTITTITRTHAASDDSGDDHQEPQAEKDPEGDKTPAPGETPEHTTDAPVTPDEGGGEGTGGFQNAGDDTEKDKRYKFVYVPSSRTRALCRNAAKGEYTLIYTPDDSSDTAYLDVFFSAESRNYKAEIASAALIDGTQLEVKDGRIKGLCFTKDQPVKISVRMKQPGLCAMEVKGYGNQK